MPTAPIQDLKRHLAEWLRAVEAGETVTITRRNRPVAILGPVRRAGRRVGSRFGAGVLIPLPFRMTAGSAAAELAEDRGDDR
jgi:prevent-host-death family protein